MSSCLGQLGNYRIETIPILIMDSTVKKRRKTNKLYVIVLNSVVFVAVMFAIWYLLTNYLHINDDTYVNDAQVKTYINPINTRVPGYVDQIFFDEHTEVKKGDTLLVLDTTDFANAVDQAQAVLSQAIAGKLASESSVQRVGSSISTVEANIDGLQAQLDNANADLRRYKNLLENEAVTLQQYELVETKVKTLQSQLESLKNQKSTAQLSTTEARSQLGIIDAQIEAAEAALKRAELNLKYATIVAPEDGVMGRKTITRGQFIQPGQQIASLVQDDAKWVEANLLEKQINLIAVGDTLNFDVDGVEGTTFEGVITSISAATGSEYAAIPSDNSAGNFVKIQRRIPVKIEFTSNNEQDLVNKVLVGMNVVLILED